MEEEKLGKLTEARMDLFNVHFGYTNWIFSARTTRGRAWLASNFDSEADLVVDRRIGAHVFRALLADHFVVIPAERAPAASSPGRPPRR